MDKFVVDMAGPFLAICFLSLLYGLIAMQRDNRQLRRQVKFWNSNFVTANELYLKLYLGIKKHMNAKGHDRCWLNDLELYRLIDPNYDKMQMTLPCLPEFLNNCCLYWRDSQPPEARQLGDTDAPQNKANCTT